MDLYGFETSLVYRVSSWTARQLHRETLSKDKKRGWRDGSEVKSIACSSKGTEFNSQQPHGGSQPSVMGSGALFWPAGIYTDRILYT